MYEQEFRAIQERWEQQKYYGIQDAINDVGTLLKYLAPIVAQNIELRGETPVASYKEWTKVWENGQG